jgi:hypothetical protein
MKNPVKELLIDLVEYYNTIKYAKDAGHVRLQHLASRATQILDREVPQQRQNSGDIDPFAIDVVSETTQQLTLNLKHENEW